MFRSRILGFLLPALLIANVSAERKTVALGLVGGITGATFWGKAIDNYDMDVFPTTGITLAFHLPEFLGFETDILYASKGGSFKDNGKVNVGVNTVKAHAIEVPILIKLSAPTGTEVVPIFFAGPSFDYFFIKDSYSENISTDSSGQVSATPLPAFISKANLVDYEWSICLGGGVEWGLGSIQMRFNLGQSSLDKSDNQDVKTFVLALMVGFIF